MIALAWIAVVGLGMLAVLVFWLACQPVTTAADIAPPGHGLRAGDRASRKAPSPQSGMRDSRQQ